VSEGLVNLNGDAELASDTGRELGSAALTHHMFPPALLYTHTKDVKGRHITRSVKPASKQASNPNQSMKSINRSIFINLI